MTTTPTPTPAPAPKPGTKSPRAAFASDDARVMYFSDPRVSAAYHTYVGDFAIVADPDERAWLVANGWGYDRTSGPLPAAYHVGNPGDWTGYPPPAPVPPPEPAPSPEPSPTPPAARRK